MWDLQVGGAFTMDSPVRVGGMTVTSEFQDSVAFGLDYGHWFAGRAKWLGLAISAGYSRSDPEVPGFDPRIYVIPLSALVLFRIPLFTSDEIPGGALQPYVGGGPTFVTSVARFDLPGASFTDPEFDVGADVRGGIAWQVARPIALAVEYRFTHVEVNFDDRVQTRLQTHYLYAVVSFRY